MESVRLDKYLWSVRLFKTRPDATDACRLGRVEMAGQPVKAARPIRPGDLITVASEELTRTIRVTALLEKRVSAKLVPDYLEDLTPSGEYEKARQRRSEHALNRASSPLLRPSKRDRRVMEAFLEEVKRGAGVSQESGAEQEMPAGAPQPG